MKINILGVTLARGGSKGIKNKNLVEIKDKPLIFYTIKEARKTKEITNYIVSTDSSKIKKVAEKYKADVPFLRPKKFSKDNSSSASALKHALIECEKFFNKKFDYVVELMATNPFSLPVAANMILGGAVAGIGTKFDEKVRRMINADGSYNVVRKGSSEGIRDIFKYLVEITWFKFFIILFSGYILFNLFFTAVYLLFGFENIIGIDPNNDSVFFQVFFFSIQTFTTVGYGTLAPLGFSTQAVAAIEAFVGFLSFSLATGLLYGRFSRPQSKLKFADPFVFSKYEQQFME